MNAIFKKMLVLPSIALIVLAIGCTKSVSPISITIKYDVNTIVAGGTTSPTITLGDAKAKDTQIKYESSASTVVTVDSKGIVTGVAEGKAVITATSTVDKSIKGESNEIVVVSQDYKDATDTIGSNYSVAMFDIISQYLTEKDNPAVVKDSKGFSAALIAKIEAYYTSQGYTDLEIDDDVKDEIIEMTGYYPVASYS